MAPEIAARLAPDHKLLWTTDGYHLLGRRPLALAPLERAQVGEPQAAGQRQAGG